MRKNRDGQISEQRRIKFFDKEGVTMWTAKIVSKYYANRTGIDLIAEEPTATKWYEKQRVTKYRDTGEEIFISRIYRQAISSDLWELHLPKTDFEKGNKVTANLMIAIKQTNNNICHQSSNI